VLTSKMLAGPSLLAQCVVNKALLWRVQSCHSFNRSFTSDKSDCRT